MKIFEYPELKQFSNFNRFHPTNILCPKCGEAAIADDWPPNYGGGSGSFTFNSDEGSGKPAFNSHYEYEGSQKCVCLNCHIFFTYYMGQSQRDGIITHYNNYDIPKPLKLQGGKWLTPYDIRQEEYKAKHGEYFLESYG